MTEEQKKLVHNLRVKLLRAGYPSIYVVTLKELEAAEANVSEFLESIGEPPILKCGKNGLYFKGCELVLET